MKIIDSYLRCAFEAAKSKKALDLLILDVRKLAQFTDFFILCSGTSVPQIQAISNEVEEQLKKSGRKPKHIEGYRRAQWVLMDYNDFVVHIFSDEVRSFYNLERIWRAALTIATSAMRDYSSVFPIGSGFVKYCSR